MLFLCCGIISQLVPAALGVAMEEDVEYRQGLPLDYLTYMGVQNSDKVMIVMMGRKGSKGEMVLLVLYVFIRTIYRAF